MQDFKEAMDMVDMAMEEDIMVIDNIGGCTLI